MARPRILSNPAMRYHGKPCKLGHTERYRSNNNCVICLRTSSALRYPKNGNKSRTKNFPDAPKVCGMCQKEKQPSEYYKTRYGTLRTDCIECLKAYRKEMWQIKYKWLGKSLATVLT